MVRVTILSLGAAAALLGAVAFGARATAPATVSVVPFPYAGEARGGWSGIDVSADGTRFWAVSDRGRRTEGVLARGADGALEGIEAAPLAALPRASGLSHPETDAEGLDIGHPDGHAFVSFEGTRPNLQHFAPDWRRIRAVVNVAAFDGLHANRSLEAVARDAAGRVYTLPERAPGFRAPYPLYRYVPNRRFDPSDWSVAALLHSDGGWRAVGADFGPDGALYLLERRFGLVGFGSRIRRFVLPEAPGGAPLAGRVVFSAPLGRYGNLEGLGLWLDGDGQLRAVMIADDNENFFQRSHVVEVVIGRLSLASAAPGQ